MRAAALVLVPLFFALLLAATAAGAWAQAPDVGSAVTGATDTVSEATGTVSDAVSSTTGTATDTATSGSDASLGGSSVGVPGVDPGAIGTVVGSLAGGGASVDGGGGSSSASPAGASAPGRGGPQVRTRFDRLPRRVEALLERILLGQNRGANLRRLERLLESASPNLRRRVLRLLRGEIAELYKGGLTRRERKQVERLRHVVRDLRAHERVTPPLPRTGSPTTSTSPPLATRVGVERSSLGAAFDRRFAGGLLSHSAPSRGHETKGGTQFFGMPLEGGSFFGVPADGSRASLIVYLALLALLAVSLVGLVLAAVPPYVIPAGRVRDFVRWSRPDLGTTAFASLVAFMLLVVVAFLL